MKELPESLTDVSFKVRIIRIMPCWKPGLKNFVSVHNMTDKMKHLINSDIRNLYKSVKRNAVHFQRMNFTLNQIFSTNTHTNIHAHTLERMDVRKIAGRNW